MSIDAREPPDGASIEADVCVVGGGPAGITLARELASRRLTVCLLESGGLGPEPGSQALAAGEVTGDGLQPLDESRARRFGGTSHLWNTGFGMGGAGYRCGPLSPADFERREWLPHSVAWPFDRSHLDPYYERAQPVCGLGPYAYDGAAWETDDVKRFPVDEQVLETSVWQVGWQRTFAEGYRAEMERAEHVTVYLHATAVEIETNEAGSAATRLHAACLGGKRFAVSARRFVLATGGIENARLLLLSDKVQRGGIGNQHDLVGRYFMEHQWVHCGTLVPASRELFNRAALYDSRRVGELPVVGKLDLTGEVMRRERLLNVSAAILPRHRWHRRVSQCAVDSFMALLSPGRRRASGEGLVAHARRAAGGADYVAMAMLRKLSGGRLFPYVVEQPNLIYGASWSALPDVERRFSTFDVVLHCEQAPDPENRVTLGDQRDALGNRTPHLHWQWGAVNMDAVQRAQHVFAREFTRAGLGTLHLALQDGRPKLEIPGLHHHMGTTRMHDDPKQGVVDANSRVHGVANLYVAGCSVFPSGGYINPTLTIVALAIRLADQLAQSLAAVPAVPPGVALQDA